MHDFIIDKCELVSDSINVIEKYFSNIKTANDFKKDDNGILYLDAIMMRLQAVGENIKKIHKHQENFFSNILEYDASNIIRFRDFISHHYEKSDSDIVYDICKDEIPILQLKINNFLEGQVKR